MFVDNGLAGRLAIALLSLLVFASALKWLMNWFHDNSGPDGTTRCDDAWRKRGGAGAGARAGSGARAGAGARAWASWTGVRVAEKNLNGDRIAEQRLVKRDGPHNGSLNGRIIADRAVECWNNDQSSGSRCRSRGDIRCTRPNWRQCKNEHDNSRPWLQSGYSSANSVANIQSVIAIHVTAERVACGDIQQVAFRIAYGVPSRHEAAARRRRRRNAFNRRGILIDLSKPDEFLAKSARVSCVAAVGCNRAGELVLCAVDSPAAISAASPTAVPPNTIRRINGKPGRCITSR